MQRKILRKKSIKYGPLLWVASGFRKLLSLVGNTHSEADST